MLEMSIQKRYTKSSPDSEGFLSRHQWIRMLVATDKHKGATLRSQGWEFLWGRISMEAFCVGFAISQVLLAVRRC